MAKATKSAAPEASPATLPVTVDKDEFVRTRNALITSFITLESALKDATRAYVEHTNSVLDGQDALDLGKLDMSTVFALQEAVAGAGGEEKKTRRTRTKAPKDPNMPKRPLTAYLAWLQDHRAKIHEELGENQQRGQISVEGTKQWHALPESEKQVYKDRYEKLYEEYEKTVAAYKENNAASAGVAPESGVTSEVDSDSDSDSDSDDEPKVEPPPPAPAAKTPKSKSKAAAPAPTPAATTTPAKAEFTAVNGSQKKRKSKAETAEEQPKKKKSKAADEEAVAPAAEATPAKKRGTKKSRKSSGGEK